MSRPTKFSRPKQPTPDELLGHLLNFVETRFYKGQALAFAKDRKRLLRWVILYPAKWLNEKGVTMSTARYEALLKGILDEALTHGDLSAINYLPAWMARVVQSHFRHHAFDIYEEAKAVRNKVDNVMLVAGILSETETDAVKPFVETDRLLKVAKGKKKHYDAPTNGQLTML